MSNRTKSKRKNAKQETITVALLFEERMMLSSLLLQSEGDALMLGIVRTFRERLSADEKEQKTLKVFRLKDGRTGWDAKADKPVEFKLGKSLRALIVALLERASATETLTFAQLALYEKFVETVETVEDAGEEEQ